MITDTTKNTANYFLDMFRAIVNESIAPLSQDIKLLKQAAEQGINRADDNFETLLKNSSSNLFYSERNTIMLSDLHSKDLHSEFELLQEHHQSLDSLGMKEMECIDLREENRKLRKEKESLTEENESLISMIKSLQKDSSKT